MQNEKFPFNDVKVRQAFAYAIDRAAYAHTGDPGDAESVPGFSHVGGWVRPVEEFPAAADPGPASSRPGGG